MGENAYKVGQKIGVWTVANHLVQASGRTRVMFACECGFTVLKTSGRKPTERCPRCGAGSTLDAAKKWLAGQLVNGFGQVGADSLREAAEAAGYHWGTLRRAKADMGLESVRKGGSGGAWYWSEPSPSQTSHTPLEKF